MSSSQQGIFHWLTNPDWLFGKAVEYCFGMAGRRQYPVIEAVDTETGSHDCKIPEAPDALALRPGDDKVGELGTDVVKRLWVT